ncbi:MAG TPA: hypothetical protein DCG75_16595 [Bacteroidales bacterium]|nr:hypothetical protein [Bacteroidales bacterium]
MNKKYFLIAIALFLCFQAKSQEDKTDLFDQMDKRYENTMQQMDDRYMKTRDQMQKEYDAHMSKMNAEFQKYIKSSFKEFEQSSAEEKPNSDPKPVEQPKFEPKTAEAKPVIAKSPKEEIKVEIINAASHSLSPITNEPKDAADTYSQDLTVDFFSSKVSLSIDSRMKSLKLNAVNPEAFSIYWGNFIKTYYQTYIKSVSNYANQTNLNDWGVYKLIENTSKMLFSSTNNQNMWMWAMLNQAGYRVKIAYNQNQTALLLPIIQEVYEKPYFIIQGTKYYILNDMNSSKLLTYSEDFGMATKTIDLYLPYSLNFSGEANTIEKSTLLPEQSESLKFKIDKTTIGFLASYPQTENSVYLQAAMSNSIKETLFESIQVQIKGKSETDAVSYLLNYLHSSFAYKTDNDQFGKEKTFFPDEIFYYPYSDCEDRTVLFTKLVSNLLGLDVIAVLYRDHMAAAVAFNDPVEGQNFIVDGKTYTICDPTYLNAPIGSVMPKYKDYKPQAIKINNNSKLNNIWQHITQTIEAGNANKIFINHRAVAENGSFIVSGWYSDHISINGRYYAPYNNTRDLWFATFTKYGKLEWFLPVECSGYSYTQAIAVGRKGEVYAHINYNGTINANRRKLYTSDITSQLVLGISGNAEVVFHENISLQTEENDKIAFYVKYKPDGTKVDLVSFPLEEIHFDSEIIVDSYNDIVVRGVIGEIEGLTKEVPKQVSSASFSAENQIDIYMDEYKKLAFEPKTTGLFASLKLLSQNGGSISGDVVKSLLNKHNPDFQKNNPAIYKSLSSMQFVINKGGIVKIQTENGKNISLSAMRIENNSNMQIVKTSEQSYKLSFLNGVEVGKAVVWYDLNHINLNSDGKIVFDYDDDHTKKEMVISEIID